MTVRPDGRALRWAGHREQRRADFVDAAIDVIEREGPSATVDQIAAERGVTRQSLYRQFGDRADLDRAISLRAADLLLDELLPHLELSGDVPALVRANLTTYVDFVSDHVHLYRFVRSHETSAVEGVKETVSTRVARIASDYLTQTGLAATATAPLFATGIVGMADAVISAWFEDPRDLAREDVVEQLVVMVTGVVTAVLEA